MVEFDLVVSSFEYDVDFDDINDDVVFVVMREVMGIVEDWLDFLLNWEFVVIVMVI